MKRDPMEVLIEAMLTGNTGSAIENQEKRGQGDLVRNEVLPKECPRAQLEALGFVFGKDIDELFVEVKFPAGWKKVATKHSMHTDLVDSKGRIRGNIFYKAAFYDRRASASLKRRFAYYSSPINGYGDEYKRDDPQIGIVTDQGKVIWRTEQQASHDDYKMAENLQREAKAWLTEHYPNYDDVLAYWD